MNSFTLSPISFLFFGIVFISFFAFVKTIVAKSPKNIRIGFITGCFKSYPSLLLIIILGISLRLFLATVPSVNFDMELHILNGQIFDEGKRNIYINQPSYNYSPAIFYIIGFLYKLNKTFLSIPYPFVQRTYQTIIDLLTLLVLCRIAKGLKISPTRTAVFYFLNPVSILLSGYHGQYDNNAMFFLLTGVWYYFYSNLPIKRLKAITAWFIITIGFIVKHHIPFQVFLTFLYMYKNKNIIKGFLLFGMTILFFLSTFIPFYDTSESRFVINDYVIGYQGLATISGITGIIRFLCVTCEIFDVRLYTIYRYVFLIFGMLFPLLLMRQKNLLRAMLLSLLFFQAFTSGHAAQYFILPISVGALFPSRWFLAYTAVVTLFFTAFQLETGISTYVKVFLLNVVWIAAVFWFFSELIKMYKPVEKVYNKTLLFLKRGLNPIW